MAASRPLLATPAAVRSHPAAAGIPDHRLTQLLEAASSEFRRETGQHITRVVDDTVTLDPEGLSVLLLPQLPVVAVSAVVVDGVALTPLDGLWSERGMIRRTAAFPRAFRSVQVTYSHGYETVPADVVEAVVDWVVSRALSTPGVAGGTFTTGPFTVQTSGGGVTERWARAVRAYKVRS